ncbi:MAG: RloB domain-containing protein [Deltaproteobacteria bacterium]|nr:RloB domain-containing protein [Deltaproteobacteria bacterium]
MNERRARSVRDSKRREPFKEPRDRVLIVCEGAKTEPNYFKHLIRQLRLSTKVLVIGKECGSAPKSIVEHAIQQIHQEGDNPYDQVWCVFDVEIPKNESLNEAYNNIITYKPAKNSPTKLKHALTNPCFEYWYILHFEKVGKAFNSNRKVIHHLKKLHPEYDKASKEICEEIYQNLETAISHAKGIIREKHCGDDLREYNPSTHVHLLVQYLQEVAGR